MEQNENHVGNWSVDLSKEDLLKSVMTGAHEFEAPNSNEQYCNYLNNALWNNLRLMQHFSVTELDVTDVPYEPNKLRRRFLIKLSNIEFKIEVDFEKTPELMTMQNIIDEHIQRALFDEVVINSVRFKFVSIHCKVFCVVWVCNNEALFDTITPDTPDTKEHYRITAVEVNSPTIITEIVDALLAWDDTYLTVPNKDNILN